MEHYPITLLDIEPENFQSTVTSEILSSFTDAVFEFAEDGSGATEVLGTQTLLRWRDKYFVVLTYHQLKLVASGAPKICLIGTNLWIGPHSIVPFGEPISMSVDAEFDLCVLDFTHHVKFGRIAAERFFVVWKDNLLTPEDKLIVASNPGYPVEKQEYSSSVTFEVVDGQEIPSYKLDGVNLKPTISSLLPDSANTDWGEYIQWKEVYSSGEDPNGRSGSPIFGLVQNSDKLRVKFAGIVFMGGFDLLHAYTGQTVCRIMQAAKEKIDANPHPEFS